MNLNRILIIQTAFIGDVILATALIEAVAKLQPNAQLDVLVRKGNQALLANNPHINELLIWNKQEHKNKHLFQIIRKVRATGYDAIINTQRFGATGLLTALSGARIKSGFEKNPFSFSFTHKAIHEIGNGTHEVERNQQLISFLKPNRAERPKLYPSQADFDAIKEFQGKRYITLSPQSVWFTKQYPAHKWVDFIQAAASQDVHIYLLGGPSDLEKNNEIMASANVENTFNLAGKLSFLQSAALMNDAHMNYVNDSGPLHLCSAMNAPVTAIFCSTTPKFGFTPLSDNQVVIESPIEPACKPCGLHGHKACPKKHFDCAEKIETSQLMARM